LEAGRLGSGEAGKLGGWEAGKLGRAGGFSGGDKPRRYKNWKFF